MSPQQRAQLKGEHTRKHQPDGNRVYAAGIDLAGEAEEAEEAAEAKSRWWLRKPSSAAPPLDTRVEATVHQLLLSTLMLTSHALA